MVESKAELKKDYITVTDYTNEFDGVYDTLELQQPTIGQ